ncbi:MAG TPA: homoserine dehydrogenase, partial [Aestuariivirga sp.]|nr:homoserine dehydrogenase [Aestuariivirga sp.]
MVANVSPLVAELRARAEQGRPVTVGLAGAGQMGTDLIVQLRRMPGLRLGGVAEARPQRAIDAAVLAGYGRDDIAVVTSSAAMAEVIARGKLAITEDLAALAACGPIQVAIDATGNPNIGTTFALAVIGNGKHMVMLNVEADITIGRHLAAAARRAGVVYTGAAGDEPAATLELIGFA